LNCPQALREESMEYLKKEDPEIYQVVLNETQRQTEKLELIASENITSQAVMEITGSVLTNKYAEGYPGKRYYGGCEHVDVAENLAIERAKKLFDAEYANVQPHAGSQANMGVFFSVAKPGDTLLGMDLAHGGHLTHGAKVNFSGKIYNAVTYGVDPETEILDYQQIRALALEHKPRVLIGGASAYSRIIDFPKLREIADEAGCLLLVDMAHIAGLVAAGVHPSPLPYADFVTTTTHKTLRGPRGGMILMGKDKPNDLGIVAPKSGRTKMWSEILDSNIMPGIQGGPLMHVVAGKAVAFKEALAPDFRDYQKKVVANAKVLAQTLIDGGIRIVSGGTDNHLMLCDLTGIDVTGRDAEHWLDEANITANKNAIPFEKRSPFVTSGVRLGTPSLTSRGMGEAEMKKVGGFILEVFQSGGDEKILSAIKDNVSALCKDFPLFRG
jgi:glycine hydroxymethyltransferase